MKVSRLACTFVDITKLLCVASPHAPGFRSNCLLKPRHVALKELHHRVFVFLFKIVLHLPLDVTMHTKSCENTTTKTSTDFSKKEQTANKFCQQILNSPTENPRVNSGTARTTRDLAKGTCEKTMKGNDNLKAYRLLLDDVKVPTSCVYSAGVANSGQHQTCPCHFNA